MVLSGLTGFNIETDNISGKTFFELTTGFKGIELDLSLRNYIEPTSGFKGLYIEHKPYPQQLNVIKKYIHEGSSTILPPTPTNFIFISGTTQGTDIFLTYTQDIDPNNLPLISDVTLSPNISITNIEVIGLMLLRLVLSNPYLYGDNVQVTILNGHLKDIYNNVAPNIYSESILNTNAVSNFGLIQVPQTSSLQSFGQIGLRFNKPLDHSIVLNNSTFTILVNGAPSTRNIIQIVYYVSDFIIISVDNPFLSTDVVTVSGGGIIKSTSNDTLPTLSNQYIINNVQSLNVSQFSLQGKFLTLNANNPIDNANLPLPANITLPLGHTVTNVRGDQYLRNQIIVEIDSPYDNSDNVTIDVAANTIHGFGESITNAIAALGGNHISIPAPDSGNLLRSNFYMENTSEVILQFNNDLDQSVILNASDFTINYLRGVRTVTNVAYLDTDKVKLTLNTAILPRVFGYLNGSNDLIRVSGPNNGITDLDGNTLNFTNITINKYIS